MEERFAVYNRLFRFDPAQAVFPLRVRAFGNRDDYRDYVSARLGTASPGAVYLHYNQRERRELVIDRGSADEAKNLPYQAFIQFLRAFVSNPPSWMREGFAIYFSTLGFNGEGKISWEENLSWLDTVKGLDGKTPLLEAVLGADSAVYSAAAGIGSPEFSGIAWSLVSFFLNSGGEEYFRALTDSFLLLSDSKTAAENSEAVMRRISLWNNMDKLNRDYRAYLDSRKTFTELVAEGQRAWAAGDTAAAELAFTKALNQRPGHYAPYYYLGLIAYGENSYDLAEQYYRSSIQYGADFALVSYALGINAAAAGKNREAVNYLREAAAAAPDRYLEKTESLIARLK
jgi:tetratricopeptide (TPR) repeat protein